MKIHEYDQMMKYLTRPEVSRTKEEKKEVVKKFYKDSKDYWKKQNPKIKSDVEYERLNPAPKEKIQTFQLDQPIPEKKKVIKKVVEVKSKPNGKYKMPEMKLDSFDWDLWLRENDKDYITLEDEDKLVSQPSIDESNAIFWENFFYDYKRKGGELNFKEFQKLMIDEGDIGDLGAKKKKREGIRTILLA